LPVLAAEMFWINTHDLVLLAFFISVVRSLTLQRASASVSRQYVNALTPSLLSSRTWEESIPVRNMEMMYTYNVIGQALGRGDEEAHRMRTRSNIARILGRIIGLT
jgi:hypothetical protein